MVNSGLSMRGIQVRIGVLPTSTSDLVWRKSPSVDSAECAVDLAGVRKMTTSATEARA
jgi:hypothetical protein